MGILSDIRKQVKIDVGLEYLGKKEPKKEPGSTLYSGNYLIYAALGIVALYIILKG